METPTSPPAPAAAPPAPPASTASAAPGKDANNAEPKIPDVLPLLPMRNLVLFPGVVAPVSIGRPGSIKLIEESLSKSKIIGVVAQRNPEIGDVMEESALAALSLLRTRASDLGLAPDAFKNTDASRDTNPMVRRVTRLSGRAHHKSRMAAPRR